MSDLGLDYPPPFEPYPDDGDALYVKLEGSTMTGPLVLAADPVVPLGAATAQYADSRPARWGTPDGPPP